MFGNIRLICALKTNQVYLCLKKKGLIVLGNNQVSMCLEIKSGFYVLGKNQVYLCLKKSGLSVLREKIRFICAWKNQFICAWKNQVYMCLGKIGNKSARKALNTNQTKSKTNVRQARTKNII